MVIKVCDDCGETLYLFNSSDVAGVITAIKESKQIVFDNNIYKYDYMVFNHYTNEDNKINQELIIYVNPIVEK